VIRYWIENNLPIVFFSIETTEYFCSKCRKAADLFSAFDELWGDHLMASLENGRSPRRETIKKC